MILVTGAAGKTGLAVLKAVQKIGKPTRVLIHRRENEVKVRAAGAEQVQLGDLEKAESLAEAFEGIEAVYFISPNVHPKEEKIGKAAIAAARDAGVRRFIYHSVLFPQIEIMPHHWRKLRVEEELIQSGLTFTILQPASYMQNILPYWEAIRTDGVYRLPYSVKSRSSPVDLEDIAEVAAHVLTKERHAGAVYPLAGPEILSSVEIGALISKKLGREIRVEQLALTEWEDEARSGGVDEERRSTLLKMFAYYEKHDFYGNASTLNQLLGRKTNSFSHFLEHSKVIS